ncbi:hypothetical protein SDJN03_16604, partial [Cucurbita argyrosperma subsp. sororia]
MAPKPVTSPVPEAWYSTIALSVIAPMASSLPLRFSSMKLHLLEKSVFWPRNLLEVQSPLSSMSKIVLLFLCLFSWVCFATDSVTYDRKAVIINGQRRILISGSIHYPRSTPQMWPGLIQKAKDGGLDVIETYVFWNGHEPSPNKVGVRSSNIQMTPVTSFGWQSYKEEIVTPYAQDTITKNGLVEQVHLTWDTTDYLWYMTDIKIDPSEGFLKGGEWPLLTIFSAGHALHVFINGQLFGTVYGSLENPKLTFSKYVELKAGDNKLAILSVSIGLPNVGLYFDTWNVGVLGPVTLKGLQEGTRDMSGYKWSYKVGLRGELMNLHSVRGSNSVRWAKGKWLVEKEPLTWYRTTFITPGGNEPLALDLSTMGKGQIWVNGRSIGRYFSGYIAHNGCNNCTYPGIFTEKKCLTNCGESSQRWYHVPREWLLSSGNLLVVFEEFGGNPGGISLVKRTTQNNPKVLRSPNLFLQSSIPVDQRELQISLESVLRRPPDLMAPKPVTSPVPEAWYPTLAVLMIAVGLIITASFFIYEATTSRKNRSLATELTRGAVASVFLGFGSLFLLLASGVYV